MIAYMGNDTATESKFSFENFATGLSQIVESLTPFGQSVVSNISAGQSQERQLEHETALAKIQSQLPTPVQAVVANPQLGTILAVGAVTLGIILVTRKRRRR